MGDVIGLSVNLRVLGLVRTWARHLDLTHASASIPAHLFLAIHQLLFFFVRHTERVLEFVFLDVANECLLSFLLLVFGSYDHCIVVQIDWLQRQALLNHALLDLLIFSS